MSSVIQRALRSALASGAIAIAWPHSLTAQLTSARPASVALTVVVPPTSVSARSAASEGHVTLLHSTPTVIDFATMVGLLDRAASRVEVRLGDSWRPDSTRVLVRTDRGEFRQLRREGAVVARDASSTRRGMPQSPLHFRVESNAPIDASLAIPVEYRLTVGTGDAFSVWSFASLLRVGAGPDSASRSGR